MTKLQRKPVPDTTPLDKPEPTGRQLSAAKRETHGAKPTLGRENYRFIRSRTHTSVKVQARWYVVDRVDNTIAWGTDPNGYLDEEEARQAQARCSIDQGAWM